jgi:PAS domain-containing protein
MAQHPIELILVRHLATRLAVPVFIVDAAGDMVYFNEPAEEVLGRRFDEIRLMPYEEWSTAFQPTVAGRALAPEEGPLAVALHRAVPAHMSLGIVGGDGLERSIEVTAFPIIAPVDRLVGAVAMAWEADDR